MLFHGLLRPCAHGRAKRLVVVEDPQCAGRLPDIGLGALENAGIRRMVDFLRAHVPDADRDPEGRAVDAELVRGTAVRHHDGLAQGHRLGHAETEPLAAMQRQIDVAGVRQRVDVALRDETVEKEEPVGDAELAGQFEEVQPGLRPAIGPRGLEDQKGVRGVRKRLCEGAKGAAGVLPED